MHLIYCYFSRDLVNLTLITPIDIQKWQITCQKSLNQNRFIKSEYNIRKL